MVGVSRALEITFTNRRVGAEEAVELGLCVKTTPDEAVLEEAVDIARSLADLVPDSLTTTRRLIREAAGRSFEDTLSAEQAEQGRLGKTPEHAEGVRAFLDKRRADFRSAGS